MELWNMGMKHFKSGSKGFQLRYCVKDRIPIPYNKLPEKKRIKIKEDLFITDNKVETVSNRG